MSAPSPSSAPFAVPPTSPPVPPLAGGDRIRLDGGLATVVAVTEIDGEFVHCIVRPAGGDTLVQRRVRRAEAAALRVVADDGRGAPTRALAALWAKWMQWAVPRIRASATATVALQPLAHQDEAVYGVMLRQPRLRFLLADEPGTGKTIMAGLYLAEARRRYLLPGTAVVVAPAHLVAKWQRDLLRYFGLSARRLTAEEARDPLGLRQDVNTWVVSLDLFTHNPDVQRVVAGPSASWSLALFDEAHRLTPSTLYYPAAQRLAARAHHLLLLTATPHRGDEHYFRALLHLLDERLYPAAEVTRAATGTPLRPGELSFLRRMKEDLRDAAGRPLFPERVARAVPVALSPAEVAAYEAVMTYVDAWYGDHAVLARSVYGKRAASAPASVLATLRRRDEALGSGARDAADPVPAGLPNDDDDEAWRAAEAALIVTGSRDRRAERAQVGAVIEIVERAAAAAPSKWAEAERIMARHGISPDPAGEQLLVFTEFTDTARWLRGRFAAAGYRAEVLDGDVDMAARDRLQQRFVAGKFQVLVSTDAGGEGIDLQSAHVMVNWDIPWSLVRLEQRMGRLHRIGQRHDVTVYHLVAPDTREGRVQEVMLANLEAAGRALGGRVFDLLDATATRAGFNYRAALTEAQRRPDGGNAFALVPAAADWVATADEAARDAHRFRSTVDLAAAQVRFADDRLHAINPTIVFGFLEQLSAAEGWTLGAGPVSPVRSLTAPGGLPGGAAAGPVYRVAADAGALAAARAAGFDATDPPVLVLGPTDPLFRHLVAHAANSHTDALLRGGVAEDASSATPYTLLVYEADVEDHVGAQREARPYPILVRCSGDTTFVAEWESVLALTAAGAPATPPTQATWIEAEAVAREAVEAEVRDRRGEREAFVRRARTDLEDYEVRYLRQLRALPDAQRRAAAQEFRAECGVRARALDTLADVTRGPLRPVGWLYVRGTGTVGTGRSEPNSERVAIGCVLAELRRLGYDVDDRQTARVGYDLYAKHRRTGEARLVEVKGLAGDLDAVVMERNEWAQAQQRGDDYWLYVVVDCATAPHVIGRFQNPAARFDEPRLIHRVSISVTAMRRLLSAPHVGADAPLDPR